MLQQLENVYFTHEEVENSPSRKDGVIKNIERKLRIFGCEIIQDAGILLKLPQVTMATAQVLFHRFYCKQSLKRYNVKKYWEMKKDLIKTERFMLKEMGFSTYVEHPHKFLLSYLDVLNKSDNVQLAQVAWNYMNDSLREPLCVRFRPEVIASACIYMAAYILKIPLPEYPYAWWELFDAKREQLDEIAYIINQLYKEPEAKYMSLNRSNISAVKKTEEKKTRKRSRSPSESASGHSSGSNPHRNSRETKPSATESLTYSNGSQKTMTDPQIPEPNNNIPNTQISLPLPQNPTPTPLVISTTTLTVEKHTLSTSSTTTIRKSTRRTVIQGAPETRQAAKRRAKLQRTQTNPQ